MLYEQFDLESNEFLDDSTILASPDIFWQLRARLQKTSFRVCSGDGLRPSTVVVSEHLFEQLDAFLKQSGCKRTMDLWDSQCLCPAR